MQVNSVQTALPSNPPGRAWLAVVMIAISVVVLVAKGYFLMSDSGIAKNQEMVLDLLTLWSLVISMIALLSVVERHASKRLFEAPFGSGSQRPVFEAPRGEVESKVLLRALEVFGTSDLALCWMDEPNPALNGERPIQAIQNELGREEVLHILGRIEHGVIS